MRSTASIKDAAEKTAIITAALDEKKAVDPEVISLEGRSLIADFFILATGTSSVHIRALADGVVEAMEKNAIQRARREGTNDASWVLLDYGDVVVHIFSREAREIYDLEKLWKSTEEILGSNSESGDGTDAV